MPLPGVSPLPGVWSFPVSWWHHVGTVSAPCGHRQKRVSIHHCTRRARHTLFSKVVNTDRLRSLRPLRCSPGTARARRELDQHVILVDPFGITGASSQALNWLDTLDPDSPDVVSRAAGLADMLIAVEGTEADSHWTDTARELLRGLLVYVATLPADQRTMAELRCIVTASADDLAATLDDMTADPEAGQRIPARAAAAHLNRPERGHATERAE